MKIAIFSSMVPFVRGGYRNIVDWLDFQLKASGHDVERIYLPHVDDPAVLVQQMASYRWIRLTDTADRIICFRPPAHLVPHHHKIVWFIHHIRVFYDLWDSIYRTFPLTEDNQNIRDILRRVDTRALLEARKVFTNSRVVSDRLRRFNNVESEVLYPPILNSERFYCSNFGDEIVCICRFEHHKRQHMLIEAMRHTRTGVRLRLCGVGGGGSYAAELSEQIFRLKLQSRVHFENRWISEEEKVSILSGCLAAAYLPLDEDSYGYPSLEASHSSKPILTTTDSGGVLELVSHDYNGLIVEPDPIAIADAMDQLYSDRVATRKMGLNACARIGELKISWPHVVGSLVE